MLNRPAIIVALTALVWGTASGCVSSTKTGKAPATDSIQPVDAMVDTHVDAHVPDSAKDPGPEPDAAAPQDTSPPDTFIPPPQDTTPPTWPEGASLLVSDVAPTSLTLTWPTASDETFVALYKVYRDGLLVKTLPGARSKTKITELDEAETVSLNVVALDEAGNISKPLTLTVQTGDETAPIWSDSMNLIATHTWDTGVFLSN